METIEQVREKAARAVEKAERQHLVAMAQPESVRDRIEFVWVDNLSPVPRINYKAADAADAVAILRAYGTILDVERRNDGGCTSIAPAQFHGRYSDVTLRWTVPQCVLLDQHGGRGFYSSQLRFWTEREKVTIDFPLAYQFRDHKSAKYNCHGDVSSSQFHQGALTSYAQLTKFWSSEDAFNTSYAFAGVDALAATLQVAA